MKKKKIDSRKSLGDLGEEVVAEYFSSQGLDVKWAPNNDNSKDMIIDSHLVEVKTQAPWYNKKSFSIRPNQLDKCFKVAGLFFIHSYHKKFSSKDVGTVYYANVEEMNLKVTKTRGGREMILFPIDECTEIFKITDKNVLRKMKRLSSTKKER